MSDKEYEKTKYIKGYGFRDCWEGYYKEQLTINPEYKLEDEKVKTKTDFSYSRCCHSPFDCRMGYFLYKNV